MCAQTRQPRNVIFLILSTQMLQFAANMVDLLTIGADATRVGVVVFGDDANEALPFWT